MIVSFAFQGGIIGTSSGTQVGNGNGTGNTVSGLPQSSKVGNDGEKALGSIGLGTGAAEGFAAPGSGYGCAFASTVLAATALKINVNLAIHVTMAPRLGSLSYHQSSFLQSSVQILAAW